MMRWAKRAVLGMFRCGRLRLRAGGATWTSPDRRWPTLDIWCKTRLAVVGLDHDHFWSFLTAILLASRTRSWSPIGRSLITALVRAWSQKDFLARDSDTTDYGGRIWPRRMAGRRVATTSTTAFGASFLLCVSGTSLFD